MTPPMFLVDAAALAAARVLLDGPEGRHAAVVRRLTAGEHVELTDGVGTVARCVVTAVLGAALELDVRDRVLVPAPRPRLVVVQALAKGVRSELAVELLTEVGVDEIVPWAAARSVVAWRGERGAKALARWRSTAREAAKQSRRGWLPVVAELATTAVVAARLREAVVPIVLHEDARASLAEIELPSSGEIVVVVGPEGGLSDEELDLLGGKAFRLGPTVLRTSTAGLAAVAVLLAKTDRWRLAQ